MNLHNAEYFMPIPEKMSIKKIKKINTMEAKLSFLLSKTA